jgi:hypothetical protein
MFLGIIDKKKEAKEESPDPDKDNCGGEYF